MIDPIEREADKSTVDLLHGAGLIPDERYFDAIQAVRDAPAWNAWAMVALLALGVGQLLAGVVFFFAYNWDDLQTSAKFGIIEAGMVLSVLGAFLAHPDHAVGQALLIAASVFTGVLLAVIGQVYQTGADAYELFTTWALLMTPWVIASRSAAHWLLWLVVIYTAVVLHWQQVLGPLEMVSEMALAVILAVLGAVVLLIRELAADAGIDWIQPHWTRLLPLFATLLPLFIAAVAWILDESAQVIGLALFVPASIGALLAYGRGHPDLAAVTVSSGFVALAIMAAGGRVLEEGIGFDWSDATRIIASLALLVLWCALVTGVAVKLLVRMQRRQRTPV